MDLVRISLVTLAFVWASVALCCLTVLLFFCQRKRYGSMSQVCAEPRLLMRVSEQQLINATQNFSPHNFLRQGSNGSVFRGVLAGDLLVAVKVFPTLEEEDSENAERSFLRECETLGKFRHRNLVRVITACCTRTMKALVLEFMSNGSLDALLHNPLSGYGKLIPLSLKTRIRILKEVASALSYLHHDCRPPILHCDVKPQNVLLDEEMTARLSDFGMARITDRAELSGTLHLEGSIGHIPPEYGVGEKPSCRGDVFSFGVLVLEMLTRIRPTDSALPNGLTLSQWVSGALNDESEFARNEIVGRDRQKELQTMSAEECLVFEGVLKLGVLCADENPRRRPTMRNVENSLHSALISVEEQNNMINNQRKSLEELVVQSMQKRDVRRHPKQKTIRSYSFSTLSS